MSISESRFMAPEALFFPNLIKGNDDSLGIHELILKSIMDCDIDVRKDLYKNVILSGGTSCFEGLPDRLKKELDARAPAAGMINIIAPADRYLSVWNGAATLSSLSTFESQWITRDMYEENGSEIVHRKCY